ncbi:methyltransferase domain-containing protein [Vibrio sp. SCSIO 43140]|nr:methyltransferase [Vibrio sp. SCSIO 43140]USD63347.1 methyltransferase domain-containing protein [Vibrio sp. SCSIO 43140]
MELHQVEFSTERSRSYKLALNQFPECWKEDTLMMFDFLAPQCGEAILEIGAGSGFFSFDISTAIGPEGRLFVVDPSPDQLRPIYDRANENITIMQRPAEDISLSEGVALDAIWSRGAFHHVKSKEAVLSNLAQFAKPGARLVICDIFSGTKLSDYFDEHVAISCTTGHEVSFLSKPYAKSLCKLTGWSEPKFTDLALQWHFERKEDIGVFLSLLHSNKPEYSHKHSLDDAERLLGIRRTPQGWALNWPMTVMTAIKE